jgi:tripartite-type tricarboxylate transporter receptor subunit TctC
VPAKYERNQPLPSVRWSRSATLLVASCLALAAHAQTAWPSKPVKLVVAFPPGGVADVMSRVVSQPLSEALGQPVIIENRTGANGNVAADTVAKAPADGYTLLVSTTGIESVNPFLFAKMPYDPGKDLAHVAVLGRIQLFLVTRPSLPVKDTKEFVAFAKANPGKLSYGSAGAGSTPHLAGELFKQQAGFYATHIPYRGAAPALQDLLASQLDYYFDPGISFPHVRTGKLKMLAVASNKRSALFPDVPTLGEVGYKGVEADTWFGMSTRRPARSGRRDCPAEPRHQQGAGGGQCQGALPGRGRRSHADEPARVQGHRTGRDESVQCAHQGARHQDGVNAREIARRQWTGLKRPRGNASRPDRPG